MDAVVERGPDWIGREPKGYVGENPLAVSRHVTAQSRRLATAAISTTKHARSYMLHALVAAESAAQGLSLSEQKDLLRRSEVLLAAATVRHVEHDRTLVPHGGVAVARSIDRLGVLDVAALARVENGAYSLRQWGFFWDYASVEQGLGLVRWTSAGLEAGDRLDLERVRRGLGGILEFARRDEVPLAELDARPDLCLCGMAAAADGEALADLLLSGTATDSGDESAPIQTIRMLLRLLARQDAPIDGLQEELGDRLLFDRWTYEDPRLAALEVVDAWRGLLLRERSVRAWHRLWDWMADLVDGPTPLDAVEDRFADELPDVSVREYAASLPERMASRGGEDRILPAEVAVEHDEERSRVDRLVATLVLGALRAEELPTRIAAYFEDDRAEGRSRLRPAWMRQVLEDRWDASVRDLGRHLVVQMAGRASQIALSKARFDVASSMYDLPKGLSLRDGDLIREERPLSLDTWFRWSAIVRIAVGAGLTEIVDGRVRTTARGRRR